MTSRTWPDFDLVMPLPTSANNLVRPFKVRGQIRFGKTAEGKLFLERAQNRLDDLRELHRLEPMHGPVRVEAVFTFETIASDVDGRIKALFDAMTGFVWDDDRQVAEVLATKRIGREGCTVRVFDVTREPAHALLASRLFESKAKKVNSKLQPSLLDYRGGI